MKIYITGVKAAGKSYIIDLLNELYDNVHLDKNLIFDFEQFCYYEGTKYTTPESLLKELVKTFNNVIISGSFIKDVSIFDKVYFIDISYGTWKAQMLNRIENGRVNSKKSTVKDTEYAKYTPSEFREYFDSKFDLYEGKVEKIKITKLIDICKNILK